MVLAISTFLLVLLGTLEACQRLKGLPGCDVNRALEGFSIYVRNVTSPGVCAGLCADNHHCTSINVETLGPELHRCELNSHYIRYGCERLSPRPNTNYYHLMDPTLYPRTCYDLKKNDPLLPSGVYTVELVRSMEPFQVYCDMGTSGGGWTLVYSYRLVAPVGSVSTARVSVWPTWVTAGEAEKSTAVPLSDLQEGALEFKLWKEIGEQFLTTSTVTNWYACAPSTRPGESVPGSLVQWLDGDLDCSVAHVQIPGTGCDAVAPSRLYATHTSGPKLMSDEKVTFPNMIFYEGQSDKNFPTHDPCGKDIWGSEFNRDSDPRGAIYIR